MASFLDRFKKGLQRTTPTFYKFFSQAGGLFGGAQLSQGHLEELEEALYGADFGVETAEEILEAIHEAYRKQKDLRGQEAAAIGARVLKQALAGAEAPADFLDSTAGTQVIVLLGVNGSGKTTTTAKLGWRYQQAGKRVLLGACDTFRAAANQQIQVWAQRLELDVLLLDTAGRLHNKTGLMKELEKIRRVLQKHDPQAPHHRWLVLDGSLGSNSIEQARAFHESFGLTGLIITKLDGTSRGGALVGIYRELGVPIYFVGLGETQEDLQPFKVDTYVNALFGLPEGS